jgi:hypothetical protein
LGPVGRELHDGNDRFTRGNGSGRRRVSKVEGGDDFVLYAHFQVARHGGEYRYMIDRSMRACLASGPGAVPHTGACRRRRGDGPPPGQRERGKRPLGAPSHKVNYCGVHAAETRLPREPGRVKVYAARFFPSRARACNARPRRR